MPSYAVVGGSRGIGLEFVRQLSSNPDNVVFVLVRNKVKSTELASLVAAAPVKNIHVFEADVVDAAALKIAAAEISKISGGSLDILIHNAARMEDANMYRSLTNYESDEQLDDEFVTSFKVNVLGVIHSVNAFLPLLRKGVDKKIVAIGTSGGEREFVWNLRINLMAAYGTTKAGTHMVVTKYAAELEQEGFTAVTLCPGVVATHTVTDEVVLETFMKKFEGVTMSSPEAAVKKLIEKISSISPADTGKFFSIARPST